MKIYHAHRLYPHGRGIAEAFRASAEAVVAEMKVRHPTGAWVVCRQHDGGCTKVHPEEPEAASAAALAARGEPRCESCRVAGLDRPATTHSTHPDFSGYNLCAECAEEYDGR